MFKPNIGDVIELPVGLKCRHNQANEITIIQVPAQVVVESAWPVSAGVGGDNHFEPGFMVAARALNTDGSYFPEGALLTFATGGSYHPDFILAEKPNQILRKMVRTFLPKSDA